MTSTMTVMCLICLKRSRRSSKLSNKKKEKKPFKQRMKDWWQWLRKNMLNKEMLIYVLIAEAIFWIPVWGSALIALISGNPWWWTATTTVIIFWAGPFTPAMELQLLLALLLKKIHKKLKKRKQNNVHND